jgi:hypothetical protein
MDGKFENERIGRIGERQFEALCERAGLCCNKSSVDVMGWDFIVEFPIALANQAPLPFDQRLNTAARVQLKSTLGHSKNIVQLKLSAIDRLVKDPHPAIIVVLQLKDDGEPQWGYLVHLIDKNLRNILSRLRMAEAGNTYDINHRKIGYDYVKCGQRFEPTPAGLISALTAACGEAPDDYAVEKLRQLKDLGYEDGQYEAEAIVWVEGPGHFDELMLGIAPMKPHDLRVFDRRFGVRLPYKGKSLKNLEEIQLVPTTLGPCEILIRGTGFGQVARFDAQIFVGPSIIKSLSSAILIRAYGLSFWITSTAIKFETSGCFDDVRYTLREWAELLRALSVMSKRKSSLTITGNARILPMTLSLDQYILGPYIEELPLFSKFTDYWVSLLSSAGVCSNEKFGFDAFWSANDARMAVDILLNSRPATFFEFDFLGLDSNDSEEVSQPLVGIYFDSTSFIDAEITYSAKVFFEKTEGQIRSYRSVRFEALDVRPKVDDLEKYGADQANCHNLTVLIDPRNLTRLK